MNKSGAIKLLVPFLTGMFLVHALVFWSLREKIHQGYSDFSIFYTAGMIFRQGHADRLYDTGLQFHIQTDFASQVYIRQGALPYNHPPFEAVLFAPLAGLSYPAAYTAWDLLNLAILAALPFLLRSYVPLLQRYPTVLWWLAMLAFFPVFAALLQGQDSILLLLIFSLTYIAFRKNQEFAVGCWLGLGLFRFHLVLPLMLILLLHRKRKALLGFLSVAVGLGLLSVGLVGWKEVLHYPAYVWSVEKSTALVASLISAMPNLRGFVHMFFPWTRRVAVGVSVVSALLLLFTSLRWDDSPLNQRFDLSFSLATVAIVLLSYHVLAHDLCLLLLPLLLLANDFDKSGLPRGGRGIALLGPMIVLFLSPVQMLLWFRFGKFSLIAAVLLLWFYGISRELSDRTAGAYLRAA
jgi:hypothetical protein